MIQYLKEHLATLIVFVSCACIYFVTFALYHFPPEAVLYPTVICALIIFTVVFLGWFRFRKKHDDLVKLQSLPDHLTESLVKYDRQADRDYRELIRLILERAAEERLTSQGKMSDSLDYFTTWVHQIKTPIASMRLRLQAQKERFSTLQEEKLTAALQEDILTSDLREDILTSDFREDKLTSDFREDKFTDALHEEKFIAVLSDDLFRIEQYVEMVLTYLRLGSASTDYVFRECSLDSVIKGCLRKYAGRFIGKSLSLQYEETELIALTDEKWLSFVIEQLLSNAVKYTEKGGVSIEVAEGPVLSIRDSGYGIAAEDLPRIFEKGYTGFRGRADKHASGLGLYLCKRICDELGIGIRAESVSGEGTTMYLDLKQEKTVHE